MAKFLCFALSSNTQKKLYFFDFRQIFRIFALHKTCFALFEIKEEEVSGLQWIVKYIDKTY